MVIISDERRVWALSGIHCGMLASVWTVALISSKFISLRGQTIFWVWACCMILWDPPTGYQIVIQVTAR
jgi:hypothetical protein